MKRFQIRLVDKKGCGSFLYFNATSENMKNEAEKTANEDLKRHQERDRFMRNTFMYHPHKPFKTISVVEYDSEKKCTKRGGIKFKLRLSYQNLYEVLETVK